LSGVLVTQMLAVAARLGLADHLAAGPRHHEELAADLEVSASALYRVLRALASHGVFAEEEARPGVFRLTPVAELLRTEVPGSQRNWAMLHGSEWLWRSVGHLRYVDHPRLER
jgi:predicted transcriptional regulator